MLLVRLTAGDIRIIKAAKSDAEIHGVRQLVLDKIAQSETLKELGKTPTQRNGYGWQQAFKAAQAVLGDAVTRPPFPDYRWFQRINGTLKGWAFDDEKVTALAQYAKDNLLNKRKTISFDFMITQHVRILAGEFANAPAHVVRGMSVGPELPEE